MSRTKKHLIGKITTAYVIVILALIYQIIHAANSPLVIESIKNLDCENVEIGDTISYINGNEIKTQEDVNKILSTLSIGDEIELVVNGKPARCFLKDQDAAILAQRKSIFPKLGTDLNPVKYTIRSTEDEIQTIEKRIKLSGMDDYKINKLSENEFEIIIPNFFRTTFDGKILRPYNTEFYLVKYILHNETTNITNAKLIEVNETTNKIEVKVFDSNSILKSEVKKACLSQAAESCHVTISLLLTNDSFKNFKQTVSDFGFKIILLRKFVDGELEIRVDNKTVLSSYLPYDIVKLERPALLLTLPVNESHVNKVGAILKYSLETKPLTKTKVIRIEKVQKNIFSKENIFSMTLFALLTLSMFSFGRKVNVDMRNLLFVSILVILVSLSKYSVMLISFLSFVIQLKRSEENNLIKIYTLIILLTATSMLTGLIDVFKLKTILLSLSIFYLFIISSYKMNKLQSVL